MYINFTQKELLNEHENIRAANEKRKEYLRKQKALMAIEILNDYIENPNAYHEIVDIYDYINWSTNKVKL